MRQVVCDICGMTQMLDLRDKPREHIWPWAGEMPHGWDVVFVRRKISEYGFVDLCPDCSDKYNAVHSGAQNTMDATMDAWLSSMVGKYIAEFEEKTKTSEEETDEQSNN